MHESTLVESSALYDAQFRSEYPDRTFSELSARCGLERANRVLDLECGPGTATIPLARRARHVVAVDPDPQLLAEGQYLARSEGVGNISWHEGSAETLEQSDLGPFDLAVMAACFHRMDQAATLRTLDRVITTGGVVVIVTSCSMGSEHSDAVQRPSWSDAVVRCRRRWIPSEQRWLGDNNSDGSAYAVIGREHDAFLHQSAFCDVDRFEVHGERRHNLDSLVGLQLVIPDATPSALGDRLEGFVADLQRALLQAEPDGVFVEPIRAEVRIGQRPS